MHYLIDVHVCIFDPLTELHTPHCVVVPQVQNHSSAAHSKALHSSRGCRGRFPPTQRAVALQTT